MGASFKKERMSTRLRLIQGRHTLDGGIGHVGQIPTRPTDSSYTPPLQYDQNSQWPMEHFRIEADSSCCLTDSGGSVRPAIPGPIS